MRSLGRLLGALPIAVMIGSVVGFAIAGLNWLIFTGLLNRLYYDVPLLVAAIAPGVGLLISAAVLRWGGLGASPATLEDYVWSASEPDDVLDPYPAPARTACVVATVGSGGAMGLEGPALYLGGAVGVAFSRFLAVLRIDPASAMVAGGAAGVAALLRQPAFAAFFAVEVPFRAGLDLRRLPVALAGALAGFVTFGIALPDVDGMFTFGTVELDATVLGVALVAGVAGGLIARLFGPVVLGAKQIAAAVVGQVRLPVTVALLAAVCLICEAVADLRATLGPGTFAMSWMLTPGVELRLVVIVLLLRIAASGLTVVGGGCGGLVLPLLVCGAMAGRLAAEAVDDRYVLLGAACGGAAAVAAGYRVPLASVALMTGLLASVSGFVLGLVAVIPGAVVGAGVLVTKAQGERPHLVRLPAPARRARSEPAAWSGEPDDTGWTDDGTDDWDIDSLR